MSLSFDSPYRHGFVRAAVCIPQVAIADPVVNAERTIALAREASANHAALALFPELGLSAYTNDDLFHQDALLEASVEAVRAVVEASRKLRPVILVGAPLRFEGKLFNCAVVVHDGRVLGIVPKTYLPSYREFYEKRQFCSARDAVSREVRFLDDTVPFGNDLIFDAGNVKDFSLTVEVCEDLWAPIPPSTYGALAGATVVANLSASNITVAKAEYRHDLCAAQSGKCICAYLYTAAGPGESTTDLAWDGHALVYENDDLLAEAERFPREAQAIFADIDLERLAQDRMRLTTFNDAVGHHRDAVRAIRRIPFDLDVPSEVFDLIRPIERFPYVPSDARKRDERCWETYRIQVQGLAQRIRATGIEKLVIGVSGGLDSTQALIVACRAMDRLELPRANVLAYTLPGYATSDRTRGNAHRLMDALGVTSKEIDIRPSAGQTLEDLGHPFARGEPVHDVTFENVQAGARTSLLFRLANHHGAMVVGTGDLSELALGWTTYGVGDQMSHYNPNGSVPKTLIQHLIRWEAEAGELSASAAEILREIVDTEISPELVPGAETAGEEGEGEGGPAQATEETIGPYELQDFHLYYITRFGFRPSKVAFLARHAWGDKSRHGWPDLLPEEKRNEYDLAAIRKWLEVFLDRFFRLSQFKRSAMPNGPKVGSGGSLSPRGDWRAPSDASSESWLRELRENVPES